MPNVYVLLTRPNTLFAQALHNATGNRFTHVSIALDRELEQLYSFARRYQCCPLPGGFIREDITRGVYARCTGADSMVLKVPVTEQGYHCIQKRLVGMEQRKELYDYDLVGLALAGLGIQHSFPGKYFCSHFVGDVLAQAGAVELACHPSLLRPEDFVSMGFETVYEGPLGCATQVQMQSA